MPVTTVAPTVKSVPHAASVESSRNGASLVEQQLDALAHGEPPARAVAGHVALAAARDRQPQLLVEPVDQRRAGGPGWRGTPRGVGSTSEVRTVIAGLRHTGELARAHSDSGGSAEPVLLDLAGGRARQRVRDDHRLRDLVRVEVAAQRGEQRGLLDRRAGLGHDHRGDRLAPPLVRQPDHDDLADRRVRRVDGLLDLDRRHVLAAGLDHVLVAVGEPEHAVVAEVADVAGVEPAVRERRRPSPRGCRGTPSSSTARGRRSRPARPAAAARRPGP